MHNFYITLTQKIHFKEVFNMPVKELKNEKKIEEFITKGGKLAIEIENQSGDHRLTLRIPKWLLDKIDAKRKNRIGTISRNLWILETIDKATKK